MKSVGYTRRSKGWLLVIAWGALLPNLALAAKAPLEQKACQSQAQAVFQKRAVEVEMANIVGDVGTTEASVKRESLHRKLEVDQENCLRLIRVSRSYAAETSSTTL